MITGTVNARYEITIQIPVIDALGQPHDVPAILDTGYTGDLTMPQAIAVALGLTWVNRAIVVLGNGQAEEVDEYAATIIWDGQPRSIQVQAVEAMPLNGMRLIIGHKLRVRLIAGGDVEITSIP
jgi:predicted aspartyl protease